MFVSPYFISCTTRHPKCALTAQVFASVLGLSLIMNIFCLVCGVIPTLYVTRDKVMPPVKELLRQQRQVNILPHLLPSCHFVATAPLSLSVSRRASVLR